jgi:hypothetical protein
MKVAANMDKKESWQNSHIGQFEEEKYCVGQ